jgi:HPt (histidine-containing phosphotransfer) domain-containing protein
MDFESRIAAMRPDYLRRNQGRLAELQESLAGSSSGDVAERLTAARLVLHDLAGTAPVMGLPEIGTLARGAEDRLVTLTQAADPVTEAGMTALRQEVSALLDLFAAKLGAL